MDNPAISKVAKELCEGCSLFGYGEMKLSGSVFDENSMMGVFRQLNAPNFCTVKTTQKEDLELLEGAVNCVLDLQG